MSHPDTVAARAGSRPDPTTAALAPALQLATTFEHTPDCQIPHGFLYQRYDNPNQQQLEQALDALEGAARTLLFPTGMAAGVVAAQALPADSHVVIARDAYFGYHAVAMQHFERWNLAWTVVDSSDLDQVRAAMRPNTRLVWAETPSNPLLKISDIAALAAITHAGNARLLIDSTFATPLLQQPLALGADIVLHSATKFLGGHGDVMGGSLSFASADQHAQACYDLRRTAGYTASPFAAWLIMRGLRTLPVRMQRHCSNAQALAEFLAQHPAVERVHYPGLPEHGGHALAGQQMRTGYGGVLSFEVAGGRDAALAVASRLQLFTNATSLGSTESLVEHRASIEHPVFSPPGLLRLSVGLEHADDLIADLREALSG